MPAAMPFLLNNHTRRCEEAPSGRSVESEKSHSHSSLVCPRSGCKTALSWSAFALATVESQKCHCPFGWALGAATTSALVGTTVEAVKTTFSTLSNWFDGGGSHQVVCDKWCVVRSFYYCQHLIGCNCWVSLKDKPCIKIYHHMRCPSCCIYHILDVRHVGYKYSGSGWFLELSRVEIIQQSGEFFELLCWRKTTCWSGYRPTGPLWSYLHQL